MLKKVYDNLDVALKKNIEALKRDFASVRTSKANPALFNNIKINYYGTPTPLQQLAGISTPEARVCVVNPYDKSILSEIEKSITSSNLGITPSSDGNIIRITFPQLTEERRKEIVKDVKKNVEKCRIAIRSSRHKSIDEVKALKKDSHITEDEEKKALDKIQEYIDKYNKEAESLGVDKEKDVMTV